MAQPAYLTDQQVLGQTPETVDLSRQRRIAEMLMAGGMEQPQGQMISGRYVAPSWTQQIAPLAKAAIGTSLSQSLDAKQAKLAEALRGRQAQQIEQYGELEKTDKAAALRFALSTDNPILRDIAKEQLKGIKLGEGEVFTRPSLSGGTTEMKGGAKYRAPIQIDTGTAIEIRDPLDPTKVLQRISKSQMPTAGQVIDTENGPMLVNTRSGVAQPIMGAGGQPIAGGKPLTETQGNATGFGIRAKEANQIATNLEEKGVIIPGKTSTVVSGIAGLTPFAGEKYSEATKSLFNMLPEFAGGLSPEQQQNAQARKNFISAVLRKESGAAISNQEYANEEKKYFPQMGDTAAVIKQKQDARNAAVQALTIQAGPGKRQIEQFTPKGTGQIKFLGFE
jgi:hypothetical protein